MTSRALALALSVALMPPRSVDEASARLCRYLGHKWIEMAEGPPRRECQHCNQTRRNA
ncbi:hypothetical protein SEA_MOLLYMUR_115 [Gordonia phage Mollymur]|uniref:Uncharacterized protein n=1 Tax=Gordonia phage Mollymur TaxID=2590895 RepID=A0A4Y6E9Y5_9CAUD|nr:hypothetical protein PQB84_gp011 [Gordonia phage Mollymur]QDF15475.1 hypothetical protein SEA_MOLLYMUR_115 [Gordonia phage Mollymur]